MNKFEAYMESLDYEFRKCGATISYICEMAEHEANRADLVAFVESTDYAEDSQYILEKKEEATQQSGGIFAKIAALFRRIINAIKGFFSGHGMKNKGDVPEECVADDGFVYVSGVYADVYKLGTETVNIAKKIYGAVKQGGEAMSKALTSGILSKVTHMIDTEIPRVVDQLSGSASDEESAPERVPRSRFSSVLAVMGDLDQCAELIEKACQAVGRGVTKMQASNNKVVADIGDALSKIGSAITGVINAFKKMIDNAKTAAKNAKGRHDAKVKTKKDVRQVENMLSKIKIAIQKSGSKPGTKRFNNVAGKDVQDWVKQYSPTYIPKDDQGEPITNEKIANLSADITRLKSGKALPTVQTTKKKGKFFDAEESADYFASLIMDDDDYYGESYDDFDSYYDDDFNEAYDYDYDDFTDFDDFNF